ASMWASRSLSDKPLKASRFFSPNVNSSPLGFHDLGGLRCSGSAFLSGGQAIVRAATQTNGARRRATRIAGKAITVRPKVHRGIATDPGVLGRLGLRGHATSGPFSFEPLLGPVSRGGPLPEAGP